MANLLTSRLRESLQNYLRDYTRHILDVIKKATTVGILTRAFDKWKISEELQKESYEKLSAIGKENPRMLSADLMEIAVQLSTIVFNDDLTDFNDSTKEILKTSVSEIAQACKCDQHEVCNTFLQALVYGYIGGAEEEYGKRMNDDKTEERSQYIKQMESKESNDSKGNFMPDWYEIREVLSKNLRAVNIESVKSVMVVQEKLDTLNKAINTTNLALEDLENYSAVDDSNIKKLYEEIYDLNVELKSLDKKVKAETDLLSKQQILEQEFPQAEFHEKINEFYALIQEIDPEKAMEAKDKEFEFIEMSNDEEDELTSKFRKKISNLKNEEFGFNETIDDEDIKLNNK